MIKAINLKTEYLVDPIGIDILHPRFYWNVSGAVSQSAYRIVAKADDVIVWDSGKQPSCSMTHIPYPKTLQSKDRIVWKVQLWDEEGNEGEWSEEACFEMGLLQKSDWKAKWITGDYRPEKQKRYPVDCFRKAFRSENATKARLYISALGLYEAQLNGEKVGNFVLAPGSTDYRKRVQYQVYDVTPLLKNGENTLAIQLADGWYRGENGAFGNTCVYGTQTKLIAQLEITNARGEVQTIVTDDTMDWSNDGPIVFADLKAGETVHADKCASYHAKAKQTECDVMLSASNNVFVTEHEVFKGELLKTPSGKTVIDFKQNIAGYVRFRLQAKKGQKVFLRYGEMLDEAGEFTQKNMQLMRKDRGPTPLQQTEYICEDGLNEYQPKFTIFGFQYMLIETDVPFSADDFTAVAVYSDLEYTCDFESSNELVNAFVKATEWAFKGNTADVPTDCPTRERAGWTGDAQLFFNTAAYLTGYAPFARKFLLDMADGETKPGVVRQIIPWVGAPKYMDRMDGSVGWACATVLIPYRYYKMYNDRKVLEDNYGYMKRYAQFLIKRTGKKTILSKPLFLPRGLRKYAVNCGQSFGEWSEPVDVCPFTISNFILAHPEESTAYTHYTLKAMIEIAGLLGKKEDAVLFTKYCDGTQAAYREIVKKPSHSLDTDRQAKLVRPLYMGLLDDQQAEFAKKRLLKALEHYDYRLGTGFLSTPFILYVLSEIDIEAAYKLLENKQCPGWLYMPQKGATTVWESWEGHDSRNHYSKGAVCDWLFSEMCGIKIAAENNFTIAPKPGGSFTYAKAEYHSIYGKVTSDWQKKDGKTVYSVEIPSNTTADLILNGKRTALSAGKHCFEC